MKKLNERIIKKEGLVNCEDAIDKMIHHLNLIKDDLNDDYNSEHVNLCSLKIRLEGFNTLNKIFQDYISEIPKSIVTGD